MTQLEAFQKELETEAVTTRKMLAIVPIEKSDWAPHEKSMVLKKLAVHVAELPGWIQMVLNTSELDFSKNPYQPVEYKTTTELVNYFEKCLEEGKSALLKATESQLEESWTLRDGATVYSTDSKRDVIRMSLSQIIHHRAQLGVYLRLLNIPIPGSYGPSADDMSF